MNKSKSVISRIWFVLLLAALLLVSSCAEYPPTGPDDASSPSARPAVGEASNQLFYIINSHPADVDNTTIPITPVEDLHITGIAPEIDINKYRLTVDGLVNTPLSLSYQQLLGYPTVTKTVLLICPGFFADNAIWTGISVTRLVTAAGIEPEAEQLVFQALDGYERILPLEDIKGKSVFLAHTVNGEVLPLEHGYPLRLVVEGDYGYMWEKWVSRIEVR